MFIARGSLAAGDNLGRKRGAPGIEAAVDAVGGAEALAQQILCGALAAVAVVAHHQHRQFAAGGGQKVVKVAVAQVQRVFRMAEREALRIADIDQLRALRQMLAGLDRKSVV